MFELKTLSPDAVPRALAKAERYRLLGDTKDVTLHPEVSLVMDMDGWGAPWLKRDSYRDYIVRHPMEFTGFKLFYGNDKKKEGSRLMTKAG